MAAPLSVEVNLADFGLTDAAQVGFAQVGLLRDRKGERLQVYDLRRRQPLLPRVTPRPGRVPTFDGDLFLLSHYDRGNQNRLGGYFNGFAREPSRAEVRLGPAPGGTRALTLSYDRRATGFAGLWIHLFDLQERAARRVYLDSRPFSHLAFRLCGPAERVLLKVADRAFEAREDALPVGTLDRFARKAGGRSCWREIFVPLDRLPARLKREELASLVLEVVAPGAGRLFVRDVAFSRRSDVTLPTAAPRRETPSRTRLALWLWETARIAGSPAERETLLAFCRREKVTELFLQLPYRKLRAGAAWRIDWQPELLRPLLAALHAAGVRVYALDGDPAFALPAQHGLVLAVLEAVLAHNRAAGPTERFDGFRLDAELYLVPGFASARRTPLMRGYLTLLERVAAKTRPAGLRLGVDLPFWLEGYDKYDEPRALLDGKPFLERVLALVDDLGLMDYRTQGYGADGTIAHARTELAAADRAGKEVFIGLETVELPDETIVELGPEGRGAALVVAPLPGGKARLTWWPAGATPGALPDGARRLGQLETVFVPASKLTFQHKRPDELTRVRRETLLELGGAKSFVGFAIHSYESYRPWLARHGQPR
ncbi:MAG: hypothetical protein IT371_13000 [Deltaproteobacteria bacterium]|nr:hypothetical protein [Deltaproteobacteria bacterium]